MIKILILIILLLLPGGFLTGCSEIEEGDSQELQEIDVAGEIDESQPVDPLKELEEQGKLPVERGGGKFPVLPPKE